MNTKYLFILAVLVLALIIPLASATGTNETASRSVTAHGPTGILWPLGIENYVPLETAYVYYNWASIVALLLTAGIASMFTMRYIMLLVPGEAAILAYLGWFNDFTTSTSQAELWTRIIFLGFFGVVIYMTETRRANYGSGGGGKWIINLAIYMLILTSMIGVINGFNLFPNGNEAPTTTTVYSNVDLGAQIEGINDSTGVFGVMGDIAGWVSTSAVVGIKVFINLIVSVFAFGAVILASFPFLQGNPMITAFLAALTIGVDALYALAIYEQFWLKTSDSGVI